MCWTTSCRRRWSTRSRWRRSCRGLHEFQGFVVCWTYSSNEVLISGHIIFPVIYALQSGPKAFPVFLDSLRESYSWLVEFMMENHAVDGGQKTVVRFKIKGFPFSDTKMLQEAVQLSELLVQGGVPHPPSTTISR